MNSRNKKILLYVTSSILWCFCAVVNADYNLSEEPISLKVGVHPNLFLTFDDSGSMSWMHVPDNLGNSSGVRNSRRYKSSAFNPMYYNPTVTYEIPRDKNGNLYVTTFTSAELNGYRPSSSSNRIDLSGDYRPGCYYEAHRTSKVNDYDSNPSAPGWSACSHWYVNHPAADVNAINGTSDTWRKGSAYYYDFDTTNSGCNGTTSDEDCYDLVIVTATSGKDKNNDGSISAAEADERQNFANWFSFYRNRTLAAQSAAMLSFRTLSPDVRVAWHALSLCGNFNTSCEDQYGTYYDNRIKTFAGSHRDDFFDWMSHVPNNRGSTPLRRAFVRVGDELSTTGVNSPYAKEPGVTTLPEYACRASYHIVMTDGIWNGSISSVGNQDNSSHTLPDTKSYDPTKPYANVFKDSASNSLADVAFKYWRTDARSTINNELSPYIPVPDIADAEAEYWNPKNDPATWQHLVNFTVGFGMRTFLTNPQYGDNTFDTINGDYDLLVSGTKTWPSAASNSSNNSYDLWHAAINSRGEFFSADNPNDLVDAFNTILSRIAARQGSISAPAANAFTLNTLDGIYSAYYDSGDWTGQIIKTNVCVVGGNIILSGIVGGIACGSQAWNAQTLLDAKTYTTRAIKFNSGSGSSPTLSDFNWTNIQLDSTRLALLNINPDTLLPDARAQDRVNYLRGDRTNENNTNNFRVRSHVLGDIIHSSPVFIGAPNLYELDALEGGSAYASFKTTWASRDELIYVGSNDGMLHAFRADNGQEQFAFIPSVLFPKLSQLTNPGYSHTYFIDGRMTSTDVYIDPDGDGTSEWRTVLVGTFRGGAQGMYALDVTDPNDIKLLWEIDDSMDNGLGFLYGKPQIARLHDDDAATDDKSGGGVWSVVIGNGINSTASDANVSGTGNALLYVIDLSTGQLIEKYDTGAGTLSSRPNGILTPTLVDKDGDLITDFAYAGDLQGNVWRFDFSVIRELPSIYTAPTAKSATKVYQAKDYSGTLQPITAKLSVTPQNEGLGYIIMFGTGKYFEAIDASIDTTHIQSVYGVLDPFVSSSNRTLTSSYSDGKALGTVTREDLQEQTIEKLRLGTSFGNGYTGDVKEFSEHKFCWVGGSCGTNVKNSTTAVLPATNAKNPRQRYGWYLDFIDNRVINCTISNATLADNCYNGTSSGTASGEILVSDFAIRNNIIFFQSKVPNDDPCTIGADHWLYALDAQTGASTLGDVFDVNLDGLVDSGDRATTSPRIISGVKISGTEGSEDGPTLVGDHVIINTSGGSGPTTIKFDYGRGYGGRKSWIQLR